MLQKEVDVELQRQLDLGVIETVKKPPTCVNPLHIVSKKNNKGMQICVDMKRTNSTIIHEPYQIPTLEDFCHEFNGCKLFTTLSVGSRDFTAFASRNGILRYTRLIFGIPAAAEIYQREIEHVCVPLTTS